MSFTPAITHILQSTQKFGLHKQTEAVMICNTVNSIMAEHFTSLSTVCSAIEFSEGTVRVTCSSSHARSLLYMYKMELLERITLERKDEVVVDIIEK